MNNLPLTTIDWNQKFNRQKTKYLLIALVLAFFVTLNAYKLLHRAQTKSELINIVIASQDIEKYSQAKPEDTQFRKIRRDQVPENAITSPKDIEGLTSLINISKNQIIVSQFFKEVKNPDSISTEIRENMVAISIGFDWLIAPIPDIKAGDTIDVIASESHKTQINNQAVITSEAKFPIRNAKIIRVVKEGDYEQSGHLVLEINEEQAKSLMSARALKVLLNIIVK
jgi:Flp pilus assembly protein CpaB